MKEGESKPMDEDEEGKNMGEDGTQLMGEVNRDINTGEDGTNPMEEDDVSKNRIENEKVSDPVVDSIVEAIDSEKKKKSRKRSRTEDDKISKHAEKHPLLPPRNNCDMKCVEFIKEEWRIAINNELLVFTA